MSSLRALVDQGGWVMIAIISLSVILYARCSRLLLSLWLARRRLREEQAHRTHEPEVLRRMRVEVQDSFRRQRIAIGAMIAAAPLLGLLGTVSGMEKTFESLAAAAGEKSMEGLAGGISEVLVATESGLAVAIPAMLLVYLAHRQVHKHVQAINALERGAGGRAAP